MKTPLFPIHGIEIEYMIVDSATLDVRPICDRVLAALNGGVLANEAMVPPLCWSNELALHVIEVKTASPAPSIFPMAAAFQEQVQMVNRLLAGEGAMLMPTAMHPRMDPFRETRLWPHSDREIYAAFDQVFSCQGHGWSNLQSSHLNLPFDDEESFLAIHHAVRLVLPLLPAIAASSPVIDGRANACLDNRLRVYRTNCARIPSITGEVIPEAVQSIGDYHDRILGTMYRDIAPFDPDGILQEEWLNARGAIARFDRNTIEIRVLDAQECPVVDLAIQSAAALLVAAFAERGELAGIPQALLVDLYEKSVVKGMEAGVPDELLECFGFSSGASATLWDVWRSLLNGPILNGLEPEAKTVLDFILTEGSLSRRILKSLNNDSGKVQLREVYRRLSRCLDRGELFQP